MKKEKMLENKTKLSVDMDPFCIQSLNSLKRKGFGYKGPVIRRVIELLCNDRYEPQRCLKDFVNFQLQKAKEINNHTSDLDEFWKRKTKDDVRYWSDLLEIMNAQENVSQTEVKVDSNGKSNL